jgi:asparagine synthase (glutamine-hydrolysing)
MCGIAGVLFYGSKVVNVGFTERMCYAMAHRGPDAQSFFNDDKISLGHRRLSIIDLSETANQPFTDVSGRYTIIFNGEIFNFSEIRKEIPEYPFRTNSDTEVLLAAFVKWGPSCIARFKGFFAFAIWDKQEKNLFIFRDRLGVKPLYYYVDNEVFCFASEVRAVLASGLVTNVQLDKYATVDYLSFQSFGYPDSPVSSIKQLEAGSYIVINDGKIEKTVYWTLVKNRPSFDFSDENAVKGHIRELLRDSVERRLISDVPVGAFLSGGIDSSTVVGLMAEVSSAKPATFNISFSDPAYDEAKYARIIAKKFDTHHTTINLKPEVFLEELENGLNAMDVPSADGINTFVVSKAIRNAGITVALSGVGGDELFAGYPFFKQYTDLHKWRNLFGHSALFRKGVAGILHQTKSVRNHRLAELLSGNSVAIDRVYPVFRRILSSDFIEVLTSLPMDRISGTEANLRRYAGELEKLPLLSQVSVAEYLGYTQQTLLKDTDQMSMAVSLEVREPFFDHDLIEFVLAIPDHIKNPKFPKSLLVESVSPLLPGEIVHRKKQGFLFPWDVWMRNELRSFCEKQILILSQRDFIHGKELQAYWKRFLKGDPAVRWTEIWMFIVLGYWLERNHIDH